MFRFPGLCCWFMPQYFCYWTINAQVTTCVLVWGCEILIDSKCFGFWWKQAGPSLELTCVLVTTQLDLTPL